jgi:sulfotransferase
MHAISGLPRSGSTLLSAILRQNPRFAAGVTSPVSSLVATLQQKMAEGSEFAVFFDDQRRAEMLRGLVNSFYSEVGAERVVFDMNRSWTGKLPLLMELFPEARVICCVRDIGWIIDSVERMLSRNPLQLSRIFDFKPGSSVYSRVEVLMNSETGLIGQAWSTLREAWFGPLAKRLIVIPYDHLVGDPRGTLGKLYAELDEPLFDHDLDRVVFDAPDYDAALGLPGMHTVDGRVERRDRQPSIPPDLFAKYAEACFWKNPELNLRAVKIL